MDVTSLLNSTTSCGGGTKKSIEPREPVENVVSSTAPSTTGEAMGCPSVPGASGASSQENVFTTRTSDTKLPSRSRTPWSANGFALPLTSETEPTQEPLGPLSNNTSPEAINGPKSPRHKFSDSYSSLSSHVSSSNSLSHSRISSMSTVGGFQPIGATPDQHLPETQFKCGESAIPKPRSPPVSHWTAKEPIVAMPAINREDEEALPRDPARPSSPSDAMLMSRRAESSTQMNREDTTTAKDVKPDPTHFVRFDFAKTHKRTISAPDFAATNGTVRSSTSLFTTHQVFSSSAQRSGPPPAYDMQAAPLAFPDQPPRENDIVCMYKPDCETGSQLRKAISHIFGRNKTCTRNIPRHVWVHYCRKHYQRSRYRNAQEWGKLQCGLVQKQIRRVQEWSDENKRTGQPGVVQDWTLSMRKREQNRIQEKSSRKRSYRSDSDGDDSSVPDSAIINGTAVPDWLRNKCGDGYSTAEIQEIVARLKMEMEVTKMGQIPDIEILPNISMDSATDVRPKALLKRKGNTGSHIHKRSQSVGVPIQTEPQPMARRVSQPAYWGREEATGISSGEKRQRTSETLPYNGRYGYEYPDPTLSDPPVLAPIRQLPTRHKFSNIRESSAEESNYNREGTNPSEYNRGRWLVPTPQRNESQLGTTTLGSGASLNYPNDQHPPRQRSSSEFDGSHQGSASRSPSEYPSLSQYQSPASTLYDRSIISPVCHQSPPAPPSHYDGRPTPGQQTFTSYPSPWSIPGPSPLSVDPSHGHTRHQSTPSAAHASGSHASNGNNQADDPYTAVRYEQPPVYVRHQYPHQPPPPGV